MTNEYAIRLEWNCRNDGNYDDCDAAYMRSLYGAPAIYRNIIITLGLSASIMLRFCILFISVHSLPSIIIIIIANCEA